jgi:hypothetical protein
VKVVNKRHQASLYIRSTEISAVPFEERSY